MATYVCLINFTEKGATEIKESAKRARSFDKTAEAHGITIVAQFWTMGAYDGVLILEADSEEKALHCLIDLAAAGNVKTETMQAFDVEGFERIMDA